MPTLTLSPGEGIQVTDEIAVNVTQVLKRGKVVLNVDCPIDQNIAKIERTGSRRTLRKGVGLTDGQRRS